MARTCSWANCDRPRNWGGLCGMHASRLKRGQDMDAPARPPRLFSDEEIAWMLANYRRFTFELSLELFNRRFGREITRAQWHNAAGRHKLGKSYRWEESRFQPGHVPANKGRKGYSAPGSEKGWFGKGHDNNKELPMYAESWRKDSSTKKPMLMIKVPGPHPSLATMKRPYPSHEKYHWVRKAVWVWKQANGPVPEGHAVLQLDGDPANCELDNLECVSKRVLLFLNAPWADRQGREHKDVYKTQVRIAQVGEAIAQRRES